MLGARDNRKNCKIGVILYRGGSLAPSIATVSCEQGGGALGHPDQGGTAWQKTLSAPQAEGVTYCYSTVLSKKDGSVG